MESEQNKTPPSNVNGNAKEVELGDVDLKMGRSSSSSDGITPSSNNSDKHPKKSPPQRGLIGTALRYHTPPVENIRLPRLDAGQRTSSINGLNTRAPIPKAAGMVQPSVLGRPGATYSPEEIAY
uniref:Uncharacterized protein n=1 Tax=Acrobeloides nanus TaxID=290746 RepID=A0A914D8Y0_9BILA